MSAFPYFLWDNRFADGTVTASSEAAGYPAANVNDWRPYNVWRASSSASPAWVKVDLGVGGGGSVDTLVVAFHNLKSCGATAATLQCSDDGSAWTDVDSFNPQDWWDTLPIQLLVSDLGVHRYWRLYVTGSMTAAPEIGVLTAGVRLDFVRGVDPSWDPYSRTANTEWNTNVGGAPLGAILYGVEKRFLVDLGAIGYSDDEFWKRTTGPNWDDSFEVHRLASWFWSAWAPEREPSHCWLSRVDAGPSMQFVNVTTRRTGQIPLVCYVPVL